MAVCLVFGQSSFGSESASTDRPCPGDMDCRNKLLCPAYKDSVAQLKSLTNESTEHTNLKEKLTDLICNRHERAVCCRKNYEVVGGTEITDVRQTVPFPGVCSCADQRPLVRVRSIPG